MINYTLAPKLQHDLPRWVPLEAQRYIAHVEGGQPIRTLARTDGCAPSTIMRQVRKIEQRRDDPLINEVLDRITLTSQPQSPATKIPEKGLPKMSESAIPSNMSLIDDVTFERESERILKRMIEPGACLAVAKGMDQGVVMRVLPDGQTARTAVVDREVASVMALKGWMSPEEKGRITRYFITATGRSAYRDQVAAQESLRAGFAEAPAVFDMGQSSSEWGQTPTNKDVAVKTKRVRYQASESPIMVLARRRDKKGNPFLSAELVCAAERLREDYELSLMDRDTVTDWESFLTEEIEFESDADIRGFGPASARARVAAALDGVGRYELGEIILRCCCRLEGMEDAEKAMNFSARSGKIVLKIALRRLKSHFDSVGYSNMIG